MFILSIAFKVNFFISIFMKFYIKLNRNILKYIYYVLTPYINLSIIKCHCIVYNF